MPQIDDFIRGEVGFAGRIRTLLLDIEVSILPAAPTDAGNAPGYRLYHGDGDAAREIGAAWTHTGEKAGDYLSVLIDDPMFAHPVRANLFRNCVEAGSWSLHWNRPPKRDGKDCAMPILRIDRRRSLAVGRLNGVRRICLLLLSGLLLGLTPSVPAFAEGENSAAQSETDPYAAHIAEAAQRFAIPERWILAVMRAESAGDPRAVSSAGAIGLMQVMPDTWDELRVRHRLGADAFTPRDNILAGAAYLREMLDRYGNVGAMLAAYNAGPQRYDDYVADGHPLPAETRGYVAKLAPLLEGATLPQLAARPADWREAGLFVGVSDAVALRNGRAFVGVSAASSAPPDGLKPDPATEIFVARSGAGGGS